MRDRALRLALDEDAYHADALPVGVPTLSNSIAKILLDKSPAHAFAAHPKLGGARDAMLSASTRDTFDAGRLAHALLLGKGPDVVVVDADDWRSKDARAVRDDARAAGKIPALRAAHESAVIAADIWRGKLAAMGLALEGESEVKVAWTEREREPVWCRGMLDHVIVRDRHATIYDLKTTRDARPQAISNAVVRYGYDTQRAAYSHAAELVFGVRPSLVDFVFAFVETVPPFAVVAGRLDAALYARGEERWAQAVDLWADCLRHDRWPEYADRTIEIVAPSWMGGDVEIAMEEDAA